MKLRLTVLTLAVLLFLTVLPGMTVFAVPYEQAQVTGSGGKYRHRGLGYHRAV